MSVNLNVPLVAQLNADQSWYASACMVNYYFRPGARFWSLDQEGAGGVVNLEEFDLARRQGLVSVNYPGKWEAKFIETMLNTRGPMWCVGNWYGQVHVIVVTGADGDRIYFNDPVEPARKAEKVAWFNQHLRPQANSVMVKDPASL